jgi:methylthioribose-1-phosphate isomerase
MSIDTEQKTEDRAGEGCSILKGMEGSVILLQGVFDPAVFHLLPKTDVLEVFVMEGRPSLESANTTCRELLKRKIRPTLIADNMAGFLFYKNLVREVWLSCQMADDQGALCQTGGLILGVLGKRHHVPVKLYPSSKESKMMGRQRDIFYFQGVKVAPANIKGYVPLMEWLPKEYITEIHTL